MIAAVEDRVANPLKTGTRHFMRIVRLGEGRCLFPDSGMLPVDNVGAAQELRFRVHGGFVSIAMACRGCERDAVTAQLL